MLLRLSLVLCISSFSLASAQSSAALELTHKVWIIGIDGLRPDALAVANTPNIDALIANGSYSSEAQVGPNTWSGPGWSAMLTGVWSDKHQVFDNAFAGHNLATYPNLFERVESELPQLETAAQLTWWPLYSTLVTGADHTFFQDYSNAGDAAAVLDAIDRFTNQDPDLMFTYLADVDIAGHTFGFSPSVPEYVSEIEEVDGQIGQILSALRARPSFSSEDWLILLSSDHGGAGTGHGGSGSADRTVPYLVSGPSVSKGKLLPAPHIVDLAVTAMAHLGVLIDSAWTLDGVSTAVDSTARLGVNLIDNPGAEGSTGNPGFLPDRGISAWRDIGAMTVIPYDASGGFPSSADPGPPSRGANFFSGGAGAADDLASQLHSVAGLADWIDLGVVNFQLAGWLGGYATQNDRCSLTATFYGAAGGVLGSASIGPVTLADRQAAIGGTGDALTGLLQRQSAGVLPMGTRTISFELLAEHATGGGTDGYADELYFGLSLTPSFDCNGNGVLDLLDLLSGTSSDLDANDVPDECDGSASSQCSTSPNSAGPGAALTYQGSLRLSAANLSLVASALPAFQPGLFYFGSTSAYLPFGAGFRCVGSPIVRLPITSSSSEGIATHALNFSSPPFLGTVLAGDLRVFQYWYRDPAGGGAAFNLTHALAVRFLP